MQIKKIVYILSVLFILNSGSFAKTRIDIEMMIQKETKSSLFSETIDGIDLKSDTFNFGYEYRLGLFDTKDFGFYTDLLLHQFLVPSDSFTGIFLGTGIGINYKNKSDKQLNGIFCTLYPMYDLSIYRTKKDVNPYYDWSIAMDYGYAFINQFLPVNIFLRNIISWHNKEPTYFVDFGFSIGICIDDLLKKI